LPREDLDTFKQWSDDIAAGFMLIASNDTRERVRLAAVGHAALGDYMARLARIRRDDPGDDLLSGLVTAEVGGAQLSESELLATCDMLLFAGHETTTNFLSSAVLTLLRHPDQLARLRADPSLLATAIEELLRFDGPVQGTIRRAGTDLVVGGETIAAGEFILLLLGAANRDPDQFRDPDKLDLGRRDNRHLAFSHGIHYCLGAALARLETQVMLSTLIECAPDLRLQDQHQDLAWKAGFFLRGLERLPVVL
jgi:cytochrome P450